MKKHCNVCGRDYDSPSDNDNSNLCENCAEMKVICENCGSSVPLRTIKAFQSKRVCQKCLQLLAIPEEPVQKATTKPISVVKKTKALAIPYRIAGFALLINAIFVFIENVLTTTTQASSTPNYGSVLGGIIIGILLLANKEKGLIWARVTLVIGVFFFVGMYLLKNDYTMAVLQLLFSASLIGLVFGSPGKARTITCSSFIILYFLLELFGIQQLYAEKYGTTQSSLQNLDTLTISYAKEPSFNVKIPSSWKQRDTLEARKDNPVVSVWLAHKSLTAFIMIIAESADPSLHFSTQKLRQVSLDNVRKAASAFLVLSNDSVVSVNGMHGLSSQANATMNGLNFKYKFGAYTTQNHGFQIICAALEDVYPKVENDFNLAISSFAPAAFSSDCYKLQQISNSTYSFSVLLPSEPKKVVNHMNTNAGVIDMVSYQIGACDIFYVVAVCDYPREITDNSDPSTMLDSARNGAVSHMYGRLESEEIIEQNGFPGRELRIEAKGDIVVRARIFLVKSRLYQVMVSTTSEHIFDSQVSKCINSFKFIVNNIKHEDARAE